MTLVFLCSNYDFLGPTAYHDQAVIYQLFNDLRTLEASMFVIEKNLSEDTVFGITGPFLAQPLEERTITPPKDEVSNTPVYSPNQQTIAVAPHSSSLLSIKISLQLKK